MNILIAVITALLLMIILAGIILLGILLYDYLSRIPATFEDCIAILTVIVNSEIDLYEKDIFESNRPITNQNYDNFYNDLCTRILSKISKPVWKALQIYLKEEAIVSIVARRVKAYLNEHVGNPL